MTSGRLGQPRAHRARTAAIALGLLLAVSAAAALAMEEHRRAMDRLIADGARHGWLLDGGERRGGIGGTTLLGARLRSTDGTVTAELERITVQHWPWRAPHVTVAGVRAELHGDPVGWLGGVTSPRPWLPSAELAGPLAIRHRHRLLGTVELAGVRLQQREGTLGLRASILRAAGREVDDVELRFERRNDSFIMHLGGEAATPRAQLAFLPSDGGIAHWILELPHQPARMLAAVLGWPLDADHEAARVAGSIAVDVPHDAAAAMRGRVQLVFDGWPSHTPATAAPLLGATFSLSASLAPATTWPGWELPHVEIKQPFFTLNGQGAVEVGPPPGFRITARGDRSCQELRARLPVSNERDRVERFLASGRARDAASGHAGLALRWDGRGPRWTLEPGCGLVAWTPAGE